MKPRLWWIIASVGGAVMGAILARTLFAGARFGAQTVGELGAQTVFFPVVIGLTFGFAQWCVLQTLRRDPGTRSRVGQNLWVPFTTLGIVAMILPLYWFPTIMFSFPLTLPVGLVPGLLLLSILQSLMVPASKWIIRTVLGGLVGAFLAGPVAYLGMDSLEILVRDPAFPVEITFSGMVGLFIGLFQSAPIAKLSSQSDDG